MVAGADGGPPADAGARAAAEIAHAAKKKPGVSLQIHSDCLKRCAMLEIGGIRPNREIIYKGFDAPLIHA
jgi:hypothetical protein